VKEDLTESASIFKLSGLMFETGVVGNGLYGNVDQNEAGGGKAYDGSF